MALLTLPRLCFSPSPLPSLPPSILPSVSLSLSISLLRTVASVVCREPQLQGSGFSLYIPLVLCRRQGTRSSGSRSGLETGNNALIRAKSSPYWRGWSFIFFLALFFSKPKISWRGDKARRHTRCVWQEATENQKIIAAKFLAADGMYAAKWMPW